MDDNVNWIAAALAVGSLWGCWALSDRVVSILEGFDIRGDGVGIVWVFMGSPAIASWVYTFVDRL